MHTAARVRAVLNLEACGHSGKAILFQTGSPAMVRLMSHVPYPHGTVTVRGPRASAYACMCVGVRVGIDALFDLLSLSLSLCVYGPARGVTDALAGAMGGWMGWTAASHALTVLMCVFVRLSVCACVPVCVCVCI
jgi:hypothetical protein